MDLKSILEKGPYTADAAFVANTATVVGNVTLEKNCSVWFGAVLRGDSDHILIGENTNIQDNAVIHADDGDPCIIGANCVVGHGAIVHGAIVENHVLVGMHATVLNNAKIGEGTIIGANALVPAGMEIPPFSLVLGVPAKVVKTLTADSMVQIQKNVAEYVEKAKHFKAFYQNKM